MKLPRTIIMAFSTYSRIPMPRVRWSEDCRAWVLCAFPLIGVVLGAVLVLWLHLAHWLELGVQLRSAVAVALPLAVTGGIHMDGFCDTCDALASHQERERKLEILKDPHVGAFAVLGCVLYLLLDYALWCQVDWQGDLWTLALIPSLSRTLSGYGALTQPNARGGGMLAAFTGARAGRWRQRILLTLCAVLCLVIALFGLGWWAAAAALLTYLWYIHMARRTFGGLTGDLAGWFVQVCELACLAALVLGQRLWEVLA